MESSKNSTARTNRLPAPKVRLSCDLCRQRKVKCDKLNPCTNCRRSGVPCVPVHRQRLPRGSRGGQPKEKRALQDDELKQRVTKLESMLRNLPSQSSSNSPNPGRSRSMSSSTSLHGRRWSSSTQLDQLATPSSQYMGGPFWNDLVQEIYGLREALGEPDDENDGSSEGGTTVSGHGMQAPGMPSVNSQQSLSAMANDTGAAPSYHSRPEIRRQLYQVYSIQVDPVLKILHRPSLQAHMEEGQPYLRYPLDHPAVEALIAAVCYVAVASLSDDQCQMLFGSNKAANILSFRSASEAALARVDPVITDDLTVLQAFVLFLVATRSHDLSRRVWTMTSVAVRIATALLLHLDHTAAPPSPFEAEMRRRVWYAICFLDMQGALDRASEPMIHLTWMQMGPPMNVDDASFNIDSPSIQENPGAFTDMTFTLMICAAQKVIRRLNWGTHQGATANQPVKGWDDRQKIVEDFQQRIAQLFQNLNEDNNFHWMARRVADSIDLVVQLSAARPLTKQSDEEIPPQGTRLLEISTEVLEKSQALGTDPRGLAWQWFEGMFVQWHPLAVAIAELYVCEDATLANKHWPLVQLAFDRFSSLVADSKHGMLWRPVEKLMAKTRVKMTNVPYLTPVSSNASTTAQTDFAAFEPHPKQPETIDWSTIDFQPAQNDFGPSSTDFKDFNVGPPTEALSVDAMGFPAHPNGPLDFGFNFQNTSGMGWDNWSSFVDNLHTGENGSFFDFEQPLLTPRV